MVVVKTADDDAARGGGMGKESVFQIYAYVRHAAFAVGEEDDVTFLQLALGDECDVLLHVVGYAVQVDAIHFAVDVAHKSGAIDAVLVGTPVSVGGTHPFLAGVV